MCFFDKRGMTLVASIMLIVFVSIAVLGVTTFIIQRLSQNETNLIKTASINLAQAGIHQALYDYRFHDIGLPNGYFTLGQTNIPGTNYYFVIGGTPVDLLMVNTSASIFTGGDTLNNVILQNATNSQPIILDRMVVSWNVTTPLRRLRRIRVNLPPPPGTWTTVWTGNALSPVNANITNVTLSNITPINTYPIRLIFNSSGGINDVDINFVMIGLSQKSVDVYVASPQFNFTVKATGKTTSSNIYRTIQAEYNAATSRIIDYEEISTQIVP